MSRGSRIDCGHTDPSERGVMLVVGILVLGLLAALGTAFFTVVQKNSRQSRFYNYRAELTRYAESGVYMALQELRTGAGGGDGDIGTENWTTVNDVGRDGKPSTMDYGEGDGIPTAGESGLTAVSAGPLDRGIGLLVRSVDTAWPDVKQVTSTAFNSESAATVEVYAKRSGSSLPKIPFYLDPSIPINQYDGLGVSGFDTNPDGTPGPESPVLGFNTAPGDPPGSNADLLLSQINASEYSTIRGLGGTPSIGELGSPIDVNFIFESLKAEATVNYSGAGLSLNNAYCGTSVKPEITYFDGKKWTLSGGGGRGFGILLVDAEEYVSSGDSSFQGLVIVRLKKTITLSGGPTPHIFGALMVVPYSSAYNPVYKQNGGGEIYYSSKTLAWAATALGGGTSYQVLHWSYPH